MKSLSSLFILGFMLLSAQSMAKATTCRQTGNGVCAVDSRTNQCTHEWSRDNGGDPMFFCKKYIGQRVSNYNRANYTCKSTGSDVCAMDIRTRQCTHSWSSDDHTSPMRACKRHLGQVTSSFDRSKYRCSNTGGGVCARSIVTNQCTHSWDRDDTPNPMYACKLFLSKK
jgi:hypothetical protein